MLNREQRVAQKKAEVEQLIAEKFSTFGLSAGRVIVHNAQGRLLRVQISSTIKPAVKVERVESDPSV